MTRFLRKEPIFQNKKKSYPHYPQKEPESCINSEFLALFLNWNE